MIHSNHPQAQRSRWNRSLILVISVSLMFVGWSVNATRRARSSSESLLTDRSGGSIQDRATEINQTYGNLPLQFEVNAGQTDSQVKYFSRGRGYSMFLTSTEAVLVLAQNSTRPQRPARPLSQQRFDSELSSNPGQQSPEPHPDPNRDSPGPSNLDPTVGTATAIHLKLEGSDPLALIEGAEPLPGQVNYLIGNDPSQWHTDISTFAKVQYHQVYPGVDLIYYGNQHQLEFDFAVSPGADAGKIRLTFEGAQKVWIDDNGELEIETESGTIHQHVPSIYQTVNGAKRSVGGRYVHHRDGSVGFEIPRYDHSRTLVIDPVLSYSTLLGGFNDYGYAIAVDPAGNAYVTGYTNSATFPTTVGAFQTTFSGSVDAFITKLNPTGTALVYSTFLGGYNTDVGYAIAVNSAGNAYLTGYTYSYDFPTTPGALRSTNVASDAFVTELNVTGNGLVYSTLLGGSDYEYGDGIAVDTSGSAYVTGYTYSADFPTTAGAFRTANSGSTDAFVAKLNASGTNLLYSTYLGGSGFDYPSAIAVDSSGNAHVVGYTDSLTYPTANPLQTTHDRGIYKTSNAGSGWILNNTGLGSPTVRALLIHPTTPSTVFAGTASGVYKSTNSGGTWSATNLTRVSVYSLNFDPTNPSIVYAGVSGGVYKSTDGGTNWTAMNNGLNYTITSGGQNYTYGRLIEAITIAPQTPNTLFAASGSYQYGGVFKSVDGGSSWISVNNGLTSVQGGQTYTQPISSVIVDPGNPATLYAGVSYPYANNGALYKSTNGGNTWTPAITGLTYDPGVGQNYAIYRVNSFTIDPSSPSTVYAGTNYGLYKSTNSGGNWSQINTGLTYTYTSGGQTYTYAHPSYGLRIAPGNSTTIYTATDGGVFKSVNAGLNWSNVNNGLTNNSIACVAIDASNSSLLYAGTFGDYDGFVTKLNASGSSLLYSTYLTGTSYDYAAGVALDSSGNLYVAGITDSSDFPSTAGAFQTTNHQADGFVMKLNSTGTSRVYSTFLNGTRYSGIYGAAVDSGGNVYVAGETYSPDFPTTPGAFQTTTGNRGNNFGYDAFITKLNPAGSGLVYSSYLGGSDYDFMNSFGGSIAVDPLGNAYILGSTYSFNFPSTMGASQTRLGSSYQTTFVSRVSTSAASYSLIGQITDSNGNGISNVTLTLSGSQTNSTLSDAYGYYQFVSLLPGNYTVTPSKPYYSFNSPNKSFQPFNADQKADFVGTLATFGITGRVLTDSGTPLSGVNMNLSGSTSAVTTTDSQGNYLFGSLGGGGNYTVTPTTNNFAFNPATQTFNNLSVDRIANFVAKQTLVNITGKVTDTSNTGLNGVTVALTKNGAAAGTTQTNASGDYAFNNLAAGANYVVTPAGSFAPSSQSFTNLTVNSTANFKATPSVPPQCNTANFAAATNFPAGTNPVSISTGDFNGDGRSDLVVPNRNGNNVSVFISKGDGTFITPAPTYSVGTNPIFVAVADFNRDGKLDLAVSNSNSANISILIGNGDGTFITPAPTYTVGTTPTKIAVADVNGDGKLDLAIDNGATNNVNGNLSILTGFGDGTFAAPVNYAVGLSPEPVVFGDFNGDGKVDFAVGNFASNNVSILIGNGNGTFVTPAPTYAVGNGPNGMAVGDFNNDGKLDLATANFLTGNVSVLIGNGNGTFSTPATNYAVGPGVVSVTVGDFNGDGKMDMITANRTANTLSLLIGNSDGTFVIPAPTFG